MYVFYKYFMKTEKNYFIYFMLLFKHVISYNTSIFVKYYILTNFNLMLTVIYEN